MRRVAPAPLLEPDAVDAPTDPVVADAVAGLGITSRNSTDPAELHDAHAPLDHDLVKDPRVPRRPRSVRT